MSESHPTTRRLVRDLMQVGVPSCAPQTPVREVVGRFLTENLEGIIVLDAGGHAVGAVTRQDVLRAGANADVVTLSAEDVMRDEVPQVPPEIPLQTAAQIMDDLQVRILYIMHHAGGIAYPAATLTYEHLLRFLIATDEDDLDDLGIRAQREAPLQTFYRRRDEARRQAGLGPDRRPPPGDDKR